VEAGKEFGLSISINSTNEADDKATPRKWKNIKYRDGGGIILRNDWTKIPVVIFD